MTANILTKAKIETYIEHLVTEEKSRSTIEKYRRDIYCFYHFIKKGQKEITKEKVIDYKQKLMEMYAVSSVNSMLAAINGILEYLGLAQCKVKPVRIQRKIFTSEARELAKNEYIRLLKAAENTGKERLYYIIQTICATGIRISELPYFTVKAVKQGKIEVYCKGKARIVFIPDLLQKKLLYYINKKRIKSGQIFITKNNKPVNRSNVWSEMKKICKSANVSPEKVFPHNLRHLFARTYYNLEKDLTKLADLLGHSSVETTRIYIMETEKKHEKQLSCLKLII